MKGHQEQERILAQWLLQRIQSDYAQDVSIVVCENNLQAPGYEESPFPHWFIPATERGKAVAISFVVAGKKHDFFARDWEDMQRYEDAADYDTMIFADAKVVYYRSEDDLRRFEAHRQKLMENLQNGEHMRQIALNDYNWAVEVLKEGALQVELSDIMMNGGYVCDLLVHVVASLNHRYIPQSFTKQYEFLQSCPKKPEAFEDLYLRINRSKNGAEIKDLCARIVAAMKNYLYPNQKRKAPVDADGLAKWYEEMIDDWNRIRGFAEQNLPLTVRGWATKLQYAIQNASRQHGIANYPLLEKFSEDDMTEFFAYADWVETDIRRILRENKAKMNEFSTAEAFLAAFKRGEVRG